jgi:hypothetical protein
MAKDLTWLWVPGWPTILPEEEGIEGRDDMAWKRLRMGTIMLNEMSSGL